MLEFIREVRLAVRETDQAFWLCRIFHVGLMLEIRFSKVHMLSTLHLLLSVLTEVFFSLMQLSILEVSARIFLSFNHKTEKKLKTFLFTNFIKRNS